MKRNLCLKREHVTELTTQELSAIPGGSGPACPVWQFLREHTEEEDPTIFWCRTV
jgi:hypothetical protein